MLPYQHSVTKQDQEITGSTRDRSAKDKLGLKGPDIYYIICECGKVYVGETSRINKI
jgi:hypothetical protein